MLELQEYELQVKQQLDAELKRKQQQVQLKQQNEERELEV